MDAALAEEYRELRLATRQFIGSVAPLRSTRAAVDDEASVGERGLHLAEQGWTSLLIPDRYGGSLGDGEGLYALAVVLEEAGRELVPGPIVATNVAAWALARAGGEAADAYLPGLATGELTASWSIPDLAGPFEPHGPDAPTGTAHLDGDGYSLTGRCIVPEAQDADIAVVAARTGDGFVQVVVSLDSPLVTVVPRGGLDLLRTYCDVEFAGARVSADMVVRAAPWHEMEALIDTAIVLGCVETVGAVAATLDATLEYAKDRKAFGRAIGSFQALKHRLADMCMWCETAKALTFRAVRALAEQVDVAEHASIAKSYLSRTGPVIVRDCLQIHGGIGFTWEHDLHLYLRRVESQSAVLGDQTWHENRLFRIVHDRYLAASTNGAST